VTQQNSYVQITSTGANTSRVPSCAIDTTRRNTEARDTHLITDAMTHERIVSMIEERRFDDLYELVSRGDTVFSNKANDDQGSLLADIAKEGVDALRVIQLLISDGGTMGNPYHRSIVLRVSAACGHVDLLEELCEKGWYRLTDFYCILSSSCNNEKEAIPVLTWLQKNRKKYFQNIVPNETTSIEIALGDALSNELIRSAQFIMENKKKLGYQKWTLDKMEIVTSTVNEGATLSLDYLSNIWGHDFVVGIVEEYINTDDFEVYHYKKTNAWLRKQRRTVIKKNLKKAIEKLDTVKQTLQEGDYIIIVNHMAKAYHACTQ
jgi:hypothetical protein